MNHKTNATDNSVERPLITLDDIEELNDHPLITFDDTDGSYQVTIESMLINEFDPISHDENEISWEYHWHDFVSFNRQYGDNVVFINGEDYYDNDEEIITSSSPSTPIQSGESDYGDIDNDIYDEYEEDLEDHCTIPLLIPDYNLRKAIYDNQDNNQMLMNYCYFLFALFMGIISLISFISVILLNRYRLNRDDNDNDKGWYI